MLLSQLLDEVEVLNSYDDVTVQNLQNNSKNVNENDVFVCIEGQNYDGHNFAKMAVNNGAIAIISQKEIEGINVILTSDTKKAYAQMAKNFFLKASDNLTLVAVTGTNGKTSVATLCYSLLNSDVSYDNCYNKTGLISTIKAEYSGKSVDIPRTTPDAYLLHSLFYDMTQNGIKTVCLEASSHALDQKRLHSLHFAVAVFTNLTQDHLDYHKSMLEYYNAKKKLFSPLMTDYAVVNIDDDYGKELLKTLTVPYKTFSTVNSEADFYACDIICKNDGVSFILKNGEVSCPVKFAIPGIYSVSNALAAIAVCSILKMSLCSIVEGLAKIKGIAGRSEVIETNRGFTVLCDYAHTPDGLVNILKTTRQYANGRIVLVFGCGGDRDKTKRPIMGQIAEKLADFVIVTSDNPRTEPPNKIIGDILKGMPLNRNCIAIPNRQDAIRYALDTALKNDIIILAGKGHEQYQEIGKCKLYFNERKLVNGILHAINKN